MSPKRVIIDTDAGVDDANAIMFAILSGEMQIDAITTVHGNVDVETVTTNVLYLVERLGRPDIPVFRGASRAMVGGPPHNSSTLHGRDGLGNSGIAHPTISRQRESAVSALIRLVMDNPGEITLLVLGPQTNLGLAIRAEPDFASAVKEVIFMGGRVTPRRYANPIVTLNIGEDPEAAHIVMQETEIPVTMLGQEVAFEITFEPQHLERFARLGTVAGDVATAINRFYVEEQMRRRGQAGGSVPDISVMAYALRPDLFHSRQLWVDVDTSDGPSRGATLAGAPVERLVVMDLDTWNPVTQREDTAATGARNARARAQDRTINVPDAVDAKFIVDWYEQLLAKSAPR
jgi:inosine-uridine nucleoside N-ribohydrolase